MCPCATGEPVSLSYRFQPIDVTIEGHPKAWAAGPEAMGLWLWGMVHAKQHKTEGRISRVAALGAWGGKRNIMLAKRLVDAGLWVLREDGDWSVFNFAAKSAGAPKSTERVKRFRLRSRNADETRSSETSVSSSISVSSSGSDLGSDARDPVTEVRRVGDPPQPGWFDGACEAAAMAIGGEVSGRSALWVQYLASRSRKTWAMNHTDAVGWLTAVVRSERERARASPGAKHVQSAENRSWVVPKDMP